MRALCFPKGCARMPSGFVHNLLPSARCGNGILKPLSLLHLVLRHSTTFEQCARKLSTESAIPPLRRSRKRVVYQPSLYSADTARSGIVLSAEKGLWERQENSSSWFLRLKFDMDNADSKKTGTRVFKKTSPNGKITTYLGKRDFVDHIKHIDPVDGVILVDPDYVQEGKKVFAQVLAAFRYGREDLDVLGLTFRKDLFLACMQVYPPKAEDEVALTRLQERLRKKLGANAYPFKFELPPGSPSSVTLQPAPGDTGKPCGVDYELKTYVLDEKKDKEEKPEEKPHKRDTVRLAIRKITYAPELPLPQPRAETDKEFMLSVHKLHIEASLDKGMYYHGEEIGVNVHIANSSSKTCKKIKITVRQFADICLFSTAQYKCPVASLESEDGFPVGQSGTLSKVYRLTPLLANNRDKKGLALDGKLKHEDTNLASSTMDENTPKENLGIIVQYKVKVRVMVAYGSDVILELPFKLSHPKPPDETPPPTPATQPSGDQVNAAHQSSDSAAVDHNLIDFDTDGPGKSGDDDDLIFEDFARLRLKESEHLGSADA